MDLLLFSFSFWRFEKSPVLKNKRKFTAGVGKIPVYPWRAAKKKILLLSVFFALPGVVGSERENFNPHRRRIGKIPFCGGVGSDGEFTKMPPHFACLRFSIVLVTKAGQVLRLLRASIDQCTKFRFRSICYPGLTCWGVPSPSPAYAACAALYSFLWQTTKQGAVPLF